MVSPPLKKGQRWRQQRLPSGHRRMKRSARTGQPARAAFPFGREACRPPARCARSPLGTIGVVKRRRRRRRRGTSIRPSGGQWRPRPPRRGGGGGGGGGLVSPRMQASFLTKFDLAKMNRLDSERRCKKGSRLRHRRGADHPQIERGGRASACLPARPVCLSRVPLALP